MEIPTEVPSCHAISGEAHGLAWYHWEADRLPSLLRNRKNEHSWKALRWKAFWPQACC